VIELGSVGTQSAPQRFYYGWVIVALAALGVACSFSVLVISLTSIFGIPIRAELGWSSSQIFYGSSVAAIGAPISAPFIGALTDRIGVRRMLVASFLMEAVIVASFKFMDANIYGYVARYLALVVFCMGTTQVVFSRLVSSWFNRRLGLALGITLAGVGMGGAFWSKAAQWLIDQYGWRNAYLCIGAFIAFVTVPLLALLIQESPAARGLAVDGDAGAGKVQAQAAVARSGMTLWEVAGTSKYWVMLGAFFLVGLSLQSIAFHLVPLLKSRGVSPQQAASVQAAMWIAVVVGRISSGWFIDRAFAPRVAQTYLLAPIVGIAALAMGVSGFSTFIAVMFVGLAVGGESDVIAFLVRRYFGLRHYSRIYGTFFAVYGSAAAFGPQATAWAVDHVAGGYTLVLKVLIALVFGAIALLFLLPRYERA
jgi:OFA family oxalate/formate antiporter-like MFS transporter